MYANYKNIKSAYLPGYARVCREYDSFPYVMETENSVGFWGLVFDVTKRELSVLDHYEGVSAGLYNRIEVECIYKDKSKEKVFLYVPTDETIKFSRLNGLSKKDDLWYDRIQEYHTIISAFPELAYKLQPDKME